jgi:alpha-1,2-rhamnosyltransferase
MRLFIDCTYTHSRGGNDGIQRTVRNIVNRARATGKAVGVACQPVIWTGNKFVEIDQVAFAGRWARLRNLVERFLRTLKPWIVVFKPLRILYRSNFRKRVFRILRKHEGALRKLLLCLRNPVHFSQDDILLLLDSTWDVPFWHAIRAAKLRGTRVGFVLYDIIPLVAPETCPQEHVAVFSRWLDEASRTCSFCITISQAVAEDYKRFAARKSAGDASHAAAFGSFRLGAELDAATGQGKVRASLQAMFAPPARQRPYITVAKIEPRKNHACLLEAFDRAWAASASAKLCIIGKPGWGSEAILKRIRNHPLNGTSLFMFNDLSDQELSYCYENAKAMIFPSTHEGFGLPIIEALHHGLPVFASDIPAHREVGGEYCVYFDPASADSLARLILDNVNKGAFPPVKPLEGFRWPDWEESCRELIAITRLLAEAGPC